LRCEVAACTLLLVDLGLMGYSGHVSARLPGRDALLIQSIDHPRSALGPDDLLVCDFDGKILSGPAGLKPASEIFIHTEIFRARPDVNSVAHFHHELTTTFSLVDGVKLLPIKLQSARWASGMPIHPEPGLVRTPELGSALAKTLGPHHALIIRAHGQVIAAESVPAVLVDSVHFVENAEAMYRAALLGKPVPMSAKEIADFQATANRNHHVGKLWTYYVTGGRAKGLLPKEWEL
jgi:ribulose-5-phosphate 4-epimerase/fuculose-1-phosphate aldolase